MGYGDLGSYGAKGYHTPNLDHMAAEGLRLTNFLVPQAVCSASRSALLTSCYPNRIGIWGAFSPAAKEGLNPAEQTIAELLKTKNYATAIFGKWHLGRPKELLPLQQGFDEYVGLPYSNDMWPVEYDGKPARPGSGKAQYPPLPLIEGNEPLRYLTTIQDQNELTTLYTERAVAFIEKNSKKTGRTAGSAARPFFLYVPHSMPHVPLGVSDKFRGKSEQGMYGDVIQEIDWSVGQILKALKDNGLDDNTLVVFTSDNGPWQNFGNHAGSAGGLREAKMSIFEGGTRVPCIVRWPGRIPAGVVSDRLASTIDLLPTIAKICGVPGPEKRIDGLDISAILEGDLTASPRREFYYYYNKNALKAVRRDNWKLVLPHVGVTYEGYPPGNDGNIGKVDYNHQFGMALYDLRRDPGERYDVQETYPGKVRELQALVEKARVDLGDELTGREGANRRPVGVAE